MEKSIPEKGLCILRGKQNNIILAKSKRMNFTVHPFLLFHYYVDDCWIGAAQMLVVFFFFSFYNRIVDFSLCLFVLFVKTESPLARKIF